MTNPAKPPGMDWTVSSDSTSKPMSVRINESSSGDLSNCTKSFSQLYDIVMRFLYRFCANLDKLGFNCNGKHRRTNAWQGVRRVGSGPSFVQQAFVAKAEITRIGEDDVVMDSNVKKLGGRQQPGG